MEIFNIGFGELVFILLLALILLGPQEMTKAARGLGKFLRQLTRSPTWNKLMTTTRQLSDLPNKIIREANLEESLKEINRAVGEIPTELQGELWQIDVEGRVISGEMHQPRAKPPAVQEDPPAGAAQKEDGETLP